jgi:hypothetical protein
MTDPDDDHTQRFLCTENIAILRRIIGQTPDIVEKARLTSLLREQKAKLQLAMPKP